MVSNLKNQFMLDNKIMAALMVNKSNGDVIIPTGIQKADVKNN